LQHTYLTRSCEEHAVNCLTICEIDQRKIANAEEYSPRFGEIQATDSRKMASPFFWKTEDRIQLK